MGKSKPNASLIKLKTLLQSAIEKYNEQSIKEPFWFVYHKPSAHDMVIEATRDLPTIANVLGMNNEELSELVDKAGRNVFTTIENSLNIATNSYYRSKFFMLGNKENILDIHTPDEQFDEDFEIPNWVRRIPKLVGGATADSSSVENDSNSTSKTVRGKDKRIKYSCGTCGEFVLPSRYEPILSSVKEELDNTVERLKHEVASLQRKVSELDRNMEDQHKEFQNSSKELEQQIKQQTDDKIYHKRDEEAQRLIQIGKNIISTLNKLQSHYLVANLMSPL